MTEFAPLLVQELGRFGVKLSESVEAKTKKYLTLGRQHLSWVSAYVTDKNFPDDRTDEWEFDVGVATFNSGFNQSDLDRWLAASTWRLASVKEGLDIVCPKPVRQFRGRMPLCLAGQQTRLISGNPKKPVILQFYENPTWSSRPLVSMRISPEGVWPRSYPLTNLLLVDRAKRRA